MLEEGIDFRVCDWGAIGHIYSLGHYGRLQVLVLLGWRIGCIGAIRLDAHIDGFCVLGVARLGQSGSS